MKETLKERMEAYVAWMSYKEVLARLDAGFDGNYKKPLGEMVMTECRQALVNLLVAGVERGSIPEPVIPRIDVIISELLDEAYSKMAGEKMSVPAGVISMVVGELKQLRSDERSAELERKPKPGLNLSERERGLLMLARRLQGDLDAHGSDTGYVSPEIERILAAKP